MDELITLYDLINLRLLNEWRSEIEEEEKDCYIFEDAKKKREELQSELDERQKEMLNSYALAVENKLEYIHHLLKVKTLNLGVKIGQELERSFREILQNY